MKQYETPLCEVEELEQGHSFMADATTSGYAVDKVTPFRSRRYDWEEDYE